MVEATVVRAPAGLGKTSLVLEAVASGDVDTVEVYAPTHALCEEQADKLREANPDITCKVIGGRGHLGTDGQPLCRKDDLASEVAAAGGDVSSALCHARGGKGESDRRCPHYDSCAYIAQFKPTQVTFYPHAYLGLERMRLEADPPRFAVIDESFFLAGVGKYSIPRSLLRAEFVGHCARTVLDAIDVALLNGLPLLQRLRSREILHAEIESAVKELRGGRPPISPDMTEAQQHAGLALLRQQTELINLLTAVRAELFTRRAASHALRYCGATDTVVVHTKARIRRFSHRPPQGQRYDSKVLIIDASADKAIVRQFFEVTAFCDPQVMRQAEVIQCGSTRCSTTSITPERNGDLTSRKAAQERVRELEYLIQRLAERHPSVLVVGPQAITGNAKSGIPAAFSMPSNVELAHFNAIRGMDCWKEVDAIVVIGRNQPPLEEVEAIARSLFLTDDEPMQFAENWTTEVRGYRMRDKKERIGVDVVVHPDQRVQAVHEQLREHESQQAIDRLRLVHGERPKRVYLSSNIPLDIDVDRIVNWNEMVHGGDRIEQAWNQLEGVLPMAPDLLATKFPALWASRDAAKADARRWRKKGRFTNIFSIGNMTLFRHEYRAAKSKQRRWSWCISDSADAETTRLRLEALLGAVEMRSANKAPKARNVRDQRRRKPHLRARRPSHKIRRPKSLGRSTEARRA